MRSFKFRVYDTKEEYWLDPDHIHVSATGYVFSSQSDKHSITNRYRQLERPRFAVEQYTNLKDKNGVEIYEGDIVNWKGMEYGDTQAYGTDLIDVVGEIECCYGSNEWVRNSPNQCKIIGNIHDNPELLKDKP